MVTYNISLMNKIIKEKDTKKDTEKDKNKETEDRIDNKNYIQFQEFCFITKCNTLLENKLLYENYYSKSAIYAVEATQSFILPDLKPLPNIIF